MKSIIAGYKKIMGRKRNRILIKIGVCIICVFMFVRWTAFVTLQYGNDSPTSAIKTMVKESSMNTFYYNRIWHSLFLEVEEVDEKECSYVMEEPNFNKDTQKVYQITKSIPSMSSGYWIVTEVKEDSKSYFLAKYYGY